MADRYDGTYSTGALYGIISHPDYASHVLKGFSEDTLYTIESAGDRFTAYNSADGNHSRVHSAVKAKTVTVNLAQTSSSNDFLFAMLDYDDRTLEGTFNFSLVDKSGRFFLRSNESYILGDSDGDFTNGIETREWVIQMPRVEDYMIGGNGYLTQDEIALLTSLGVTVEDRWIRE